MSQRIPVAFRAEYRGQAQASTFTDRTTGEVVELAPNLKFEYELADGEPETLAVRATALDKAVDFDVTKLSKGEWLHFEGFVVLGGPDQRSYFRPLVVRKVDPKSAVRAA